MLVCVVQRKETLLVEYQNRGKANKFVDKRFGEADQDLSVEDKMLQRFALEKQVWLCINTPGKPMFDQQHVLG